MEVFVDFSQVFVGEMSVDLRGADVGVAEHHLDRADVGAVLQKIGGERVAQLVRADLFYHSGRDRVFFYHPLHRAGSEARRFFLF